MAVETVKPWNEKITLKRLLFHERRKAERVTIHDTLFVDYHSPIHLTSGTGEGRDISTRGIRFACYEQFAKGTPLDLTLRFSDAYAPNKFLQARGYVVRCYRKRLQHRFRIACAFDHIEAMHHDEIENFVRWQKERERLYFYL